MEKTEQNRFEELVSVYGADFDRWPVDHRRWGEAFLKDNTGAYNILDGYLGVESALNGISVVEPDSNIQARIMADYAELNRRGVDRRHRAGIRTPFSEFMDALRDLFPSAQPWQAGALSAGVMVVGIFLGAFYLDQASSEDDFLMALSGETNGWETDFETGSMQNDGGDV